MLERLRSWWTRPSRSDVDLEAARAKLRESMPVPVLWLIGKTQSGKSSVTRSLVGVPDISIGEGYRPVTRTTMRYDFPSKEDALLSFLDTRGLGEAGYDSAENVAECLDQAHAGLVVVKAMDHAQAPVHETLKLIRKRNRKLPIVLIVTCLHEAYPQQQHPSIDVFHEGKIFPENAPPEYHTALEKLSASVDQHRSQFAGLFDRLVLVDLTKPDDGYEPADLGLDQLKTTLVDVLPDAYGQAISRLQEAMGQLSDLTEAKAQPIIYSASTYAAGVSAIPAPWIDIPGVAAIQSRMVYEIAALYGQQAMGRRFWELAGAVGAGIAARQLLKGLLKVVPGLGMAVGAATGFAATFALGKASCWYFEAIRKGHEPTRQELQQVFREELRRAEKLWNVRRAEAPKE